MSATNATALYETALAEYGEENPETLDELIQIVIPANAAHVAVVSDLRESLVQYQGNFVDALILTAVSHTWIAPELSEAGTVVKDGIRRLLRFVPDLQADLLDAAENFVDEDDEDQRFEVYEFVQERLWNNLRETPPAPGVDDLHALIRGIIEVIREETRND